MANNLVPPRQTLKTNESPCNDVESAVNMLIPERILDLNQLSEVDSVSLPPILETQKSSRNDV